MKQSVFQIRIEDDLLQKLRIFAAERHVSISTIVREAIRSTLRQPNATAIPSVYKSSEQINPLAGMSLPEIVAYEKEKDRRRAERYNKAA